MARLRAAGAIVIGKTNLDQFATGLVGVRSPYGVPRNAINPELIPGGSSSGSAAAVAAGLVPLALGTDTAGSGRVPAGLNNIVGLKPSLGLISTAGVVPACRSLDCVSVFALTTDDAWAALAVMAGPDVADPYSRARPLKPAGAFAKGTRVGVPIAGQRVFFGDRASAAAFDRAIARAAALGLDIVEVDIEPFYETARLLYEGPWVAERYIVLKSLLASSPESIHPVTREIVVAGARPSAVDTFAAFYKLEELRRVRDVTFRSVDALLLPTAPTAYTVKQVLADPIQLNSRLGTYTNFVNLLDLCGLAVPASMRDDGIPFGVTLLGARRARRTAGLDRTRLSRRYGPADGRAEAAAAAARDAVGRAGRGRDRHRGGRRASVRHAAQRRAQGAGRAAARRNLHGARLSTLCAGGGEPAEARAASRGARAGQRHRARSLGADGRGLRAVCRRYSIADVDRHVAPQ